MLDAKELKNLMSQKDGGILIAYLMEHHLEILELIEERDRFALAIKEALAEADEWLHDFEDEVSASNTIISIGVILSKHENRIKELLPDEIS